MKLKTLAPRLSCIVTTRLAPAQETPRLRGRAGMDRRARWLRQHPLCVHCLAEDRVTAGQVVDHIVPLWRGGADDFETNGQTLCHAHHDAKTAEEAEQRSRGG